MVQYPHDVGVDCLETEEDFVLKPFAPFRSGPIRVKKFYGHVLAGSISCAPDSTCAALPDYKSQGVSIEGGLYCSHLAGFSHIDR